MPDYYRMPTDEVLQSLDSNLDGLTSSEAERRLTEKGANLLQSTPPLSGWKILINQFANFIIYLLLFAVLFSIIIGEYADSLVILAILIMNGMIGFFQELHANRSLEALKNMQTVTTSVLRNGKVITIEGSQLVYGDIVHLENGDKVPADARLIEAIELLTEESTLTGESEPARKQIEPITGDSGIADQVNMVFSGTSIVAGRGIAVITACGMETEIGKISQLVADAIDEKTPLQRRLDLFGKKLGLVIIIICLIVFCLLLTRYYLDDNSINRHIFLEFAFIAISLAVAAVPTALPAVVTIALSIGTKRLLAKNMLVRRLTSVETLGSCDVICSDKTGTLTQNKMTVQHCWTLGQNLDFKRNNIIEKTAEAPDLQKLFTIGAECNNSIHKFASSAGGNPTELALLASARTAGIIPRAQRLSERPFDSGRKCMSVLMQQDGANYLYIKGAVDKILELCTHICNDGETVVLTEEYRRLVLQTNDHFTSQAMRVMAFASKEVDSIDEMKEECLTFVGLQAMLDPPREEVKESISIATRAHIRTLMITGDHPQTAQAIAREIGINGATVTGTELDNMDDEQLEKALQHVYIFARVVPEHKQRIVKALQRAGHVVAMTGDGVNDAPALKQADIGIAVGSGTDVAHEAADFVLLDDSFSSIVDGVEEGRGIYENIQKSIMLLLSGNLMEVLIIVIAVLLGFNLPLTALLLLWINLITDGAPALAYSVDPYGANIMRRSPLSLREGLLPNHKLRLLIGLSISGALIGLAMFHLSDGNSNDAMSIQKAQTMVFNYIVLYEMMLVFVIRKSYQVKLFSNLWLWASVLFSILMQGIIMYSPARLLFHITPLGPPELVVLSAATVLFFIVCLLFTQGSERSRATTNS